MTNLTLTLAFYPADLEKAQNLLHWIAELGGCKKHNLLLVADSQVKPETVREMRENMRQWFNDVNAIIVTEPSGFKAGWPNSPSFKFFRAAEFIHRNFKQPFFWLEPDAIPLKKGWLDSLADEYSLSPSKFMGTVMQNDNSTILEKAHLNGVALYPNDAWLFYQPREKDVLEKGIAWDVYDSMKIVSQSRNTLQIQNVWGPALETPPFIVSEKKDGDPAHYMDFRALWKDAVLFHRNKEQNLIPLLREQLSRAIAKKVPAK